jgi:IMP dehydrogenase
MVKEVKNHKAGFVISEANVQPSQSLEAAIEITNQTGHSTVAVTDDGTPHGELLGLLTRNDYLIGYSDTSQPVRDFMTPLKDLVFASESISLGDANSLLYDQKKGKLPILSRDRHLKSIVFRKDWEGRNAFPHQLVDDDKRIRVAAAISTRDYKDRVPALIDAGADVLCFDSSQGYSEHQKNAATWIRGKYGKEIILGGGNITNERAFNYLVKEADLDFIKIGIGGGSICITRQQTSMGKGQGSAILEVAQARDTYFEDTGIYIPLMGDGSISADGQINVALALGADHVMMGRYFAACNESPPNLINENNIRFKPYWGEGSQRAKNWDRYDAENGHFEEGVEGKIVCSGPLSTNVNQTLLKIRDGLRKFGCRNIQQLHDTAHLQVISPATIEESGAHGIFTLQSSTYAQDHKV